MVKQPIRHIWVISLAIFQLLIAGATGYLYWHIHHAIPATNQQLSAEVCVLMPIVERLTERKYKHTINCRLISRDQYIQLYIQSFLRAHSGTNTKNLQTEAKDQAKRFAADAIAAFDSKSSTLYLIRDNFLRRVAKVSARYHHDILQFELAHEMTHAMQYQWLVNYDSISTPLTYDQRMIHEMLTEGFARYIEREVIIVLHLQQAAKEIREHKVGNISKRNKYDDFVHVRYLLYYHDVYIVGYKYICWQMQHGGSIAKIWQILANQPLQTADLFHPEAAPSHDLIARHPISLIGLEQILGNDPWHLAYWSEAGEFVLRRVFANSGQKERDLLVNNILYFYYMGSTSDTHTVELTYILLRNPAQGAIVFTKLKEYHINELIAMSSSSKFPTSTTISTGFTEMPDKYATMLTTTFSDRTTQKITLVLRDNVIIRIWTKNLDLPPARYATIAEKLFQRLTAAKVLNNNGVD